MLAGLHEILMRHRRKFLMTGVIVGGTYVALRYAQKKFIEMQERQAREFMKKSQRLQHFESTEKSCNQVIIGMGAELIGAIIKQCSTEELLEQLRDNPANKVELWEEMKIQSFVRLATFVYANSMLVVALRVQMNLLGGYFYQSATADADAVPAPQPMHKHLSFFYLSLVQYFTEEEGLSDLVALIRSKVIAVIKQLPLTKSLSLADIEQLFWSLQMAINSDPKLDPCSKMCKYMLPSQLPDYATGIPLLGKMFNETVDMLESDDASAVCSNNVSRGFSLVVDAIADSYRDSAVRSKNTEGPAAANTDTVASAVAGAVAEASAENDYLNINNVQLALARVIPIISGLTAKGYDESVRPQNLATSLVSFYVISEKSKTLGANVYETFSTS